MSEEMQVELLDVVWAEGFSAIEKGELGYYSNGATEGWLLISYFLFRVDFI